MERRYQIPRMSFLWCGNITEMRCLFCQRSNEGKEVPSLWKFKDAIWQTSLSCLSVFLSLKHVLKVVSCSPKEHSDDYQLPRSKVAVEV